MVRGKEERLKVQSHWEKEWVSEVQYGETSSGLEAGDSDAGPSLAPISVTFSMPDELSASQDHHSGNGDVRGGDLYRSLVFYNLLLERKKAMI